MDAITPPAELAAANAPAPMLHDITIVTTKKLAQARVLGVPPEEFGIERSARDIKTCNYCYHEVVTKTESELITEGFDEDQIRSLGDYTGNSDVETIARDSVQETMGGNGINTAARLVKITEHYVRMDYEGNGRACLYLVVTGGDQGEILKKDGKECIEPIDVIPFATTTPVPITHRFFGRSIADLVMDIQKIKTALMRGMLDNVYLHNAPRPVVSEAHSGPNTIDDILTVRQGSPIRMKQPGGIEWQVVPDITGSIYPALSYLDGTREMRTGVSKQSQGVDANALQNQTAEAVATVFNASQMRMKLIARIMAEGVRDIFSLLHHTIRTRGQEQQTVRLRNQWVPVDPRNWKTRNDMTINVGLGTGGKAQQFAQTTALANVQKEMIQGGLTQVVDPKKVYNTAAELARIMGHRNPDKFFNDPDEKNADGTPKYPPPPPAVDPKLEQIKLQAQTDQLAAQQKADIEKLQAQADIATQNSKTNAEIALAQQKADLEAKLALLDFQMREREHELKVTELHHKMAAQEQLHQHAVTESKMGLISTAVTHDAKMEQGQQTHQAKLAKMKEKPDAGS